MNKLVKGYTVNKEIEINGVFTYCAELFFRNEVAAWFFNKMDSFKRMVLMQATAFEITNETEKAIEFEITYVVKNVNKIKVWFPKSVFNKVA